MAQQEPLLGGCRVLDLTDEKEGLRLGYSDPCRVRSEVIMTSRSPFGQTGTYAHYQATDVIGVSMGVFARILGDLGCLPMRMSRDPHAYSHQEFGR